MVHSWDNQQEDSVPPSPSFSSLDCQDILTSVSLSVVNRLALGRPENMDSDREGSGVTK